MCSHRSAGIGHYPMPFDRLAHFWFCFYLHLQTSFVRPFTCKKQTHRIQPPCMDVKTTGLCTASQSQRIQKYPQRRWSRQCALSITQQQEHRTQVPVNKMRHGKTGGNFPTRAFRALSNCHKQRIGLKTSTTNPQIFYKVLMK